MVGGDPTGLTEWPWQASLVDVSQSVTGSQYCGGTLISASWVVTAAHCTYQREAGDIAIVVGRQSLNKVSSTSQVYLSYLRYDYIYSVSHVIIIVL